MAGLAYVYNGSVYQMTDPSMVNPSFGTARLNIRTGSGENDVVKYGFTSDTSASSYCKLKFIIGGKECYIGRSQVLYETVERDDWVETSQWIQDVGNSSATSAPVEGATRFLYNSYSSTTTATLGNRTSTNSSFVSSSESSSTDVNQTHLISIYGYRSSRFTTSLGTYTRTNQYVDPGYTSTLSTEQVVDSNGQTIELSTYSHTYASTTVTSRITKTASLSLSSTRQDSYGNVTYSGKTSRYSTSKTGRCSRSYSTYSYSMIHRTTVMSSTTYYTSTTYVMGTATTHNFNM